MGQAQCPVHGLREMKENRKYSSKPAAELNVRNSLETQPGPEKSGQLDSSSDLSSFSRGRPGQWSLRLGRSASALQRQSSVRIPTRKLSDGSEPSPRKINFLPELPDYFKRTDCRSSLSLSNTKTSHHQDVSLNTNISSPLSGSVVKVINQNFHQLR